MAAATAQQARVMHEEAVGKNAGLARVAELRGERTVDGGIDVGRTLERCCAMTLRQLFQAMSASSIARRVSAAPNCGTLPSLAPVAGSKTSSVRPSSASRQAPPTKACWRSSAESRSAPPIAR